MGKTQWEELAARAARADKHAEGQRAKDAAIGARIMAYNMAE
jgi:hypothetical protein